MFGYVKPQHSELLVREYEFYRATYCGICRAMKRNTGFTSNFTLSYDSVFLAMVRMLYIDDSEISSEMRRCIAHPTKKKCMLSENSALEYTARAFAILTYYKLCDDQQDEQTAKRLLVSIAKPFLSSSKNKANLPHLADRIKRKLDEITELEKQAVASVDRPATLFGELLGDVFSEGIDSEQRLVPYSVGYHLGRFIYAADAAEDYEEDRKNKRYNPYVLAYGNSPMTDEMKSTIKCALLLECKKLEGAVNLLPFGKKKTAESIIENIIYLGLPKRIEFLDTKTENKQGAEQ